MPEPTFQPTQEEIITAITTIQLKMLNLNHAGIPVRFEHCLDPHYEKHSGATILEPNKFHRAIFYPTTTEQKKIIDQAATKIRAEMGLLFASSSNDDEQDLEHPENWLFEIEWILDSQFQITPIWRDYLEKNPFIPQTLPSVEE